MHVLMVVTESDLGGAQRHVLDVSRELQKRGIMVSIAAGGTHHAIFTAATEIVPSISVYRIKDLVREIHPMKEMRALWQVYRLVRKLRPEIVHCHSSKAGVIASIAGKLAGARVVYTAHGFVFREDISTKKKIFYQLTERVASWFRDRVIAVSESDREAALAAHIVKANKILTIHNGIAADQRMFLDRNTARREVSRWAGVNLMHAHVVLTIANLYPAKNIPTLIRAFEYVVRRDQLARLVIVGEGEERAYCEAIVRATPILAKSVFLVGARAHAASVMKAADVFCLSSTKEGLPYTLLEAKLAGVPIVATRVGGIAEIGEGADCALVVPHSPELLAEKITKMLQNPPAAQSHLSQEFTLSHMVNRIEEVYHAVMNRL